ncbi:MAG: PAS domain-containing protein, partial [Oscillospiraceae bacterium]|nr:PAS domain-containing protein [Oscillospiraceae bacterium]
MSENFENSRAGPGSPGVDELKKEIRALKRKLSLLEINSERALRYSAMQNRMESILNESIRKDLQFFKLVLENSISILLLLDFDGRFAYASDSFLRELEIGSFGLINGMHYREVLQSRISDENLERFSRSLDIAVSSGQSVAYEFVQQRARRTFSTVITPMTDEEGKSTGIMALFNDITEINEAMESAKRANMAKSDFLANMSHEMRTPMNAIIGMTAIGKASADVGRKDYCLAKIEDASHHLLGVISDILDMSKIEANKFELSPVYFEFEGMLRQAVNVAGYRAEEKKQRLMVRIDKRIPKTLYGDDQRLAQVVANLLGNAVKFTGEGGSVSLDARLLSEDDGLCTVQVSITDTGIGISKAQQSRIFSSFQQAENSTTRKFGGTGLGLAISRNIVEMMKGRIWVESEEGRGSAFTFTVVLNHAGLAESGAAKRPGPPVS